MLVFGALGGITLDGIGLRDILFRGVIVTGFWLSRYLPSLSDERRRQVLKEVMQLLVDGVIKPKGGELQLYGSVLQAILSHMSQHLGWMHAIMAAPQYLVHHGACRVKFLMSSRCGPCRRQVSAGAGQGGHRGVTEVRQEGQSSAGRLSIAIVLDAYGT